MKKRVKNKGNHFNFNLEYKKCFSFIRDSREYIYFIVLLFFIFGVIGFFFQDIINTVFSYLFKLNLRDHILAYLQELLLKTEGMSQKELTGFIFLNNLQSSLYGFILGILFGIFPIFSIVINGYLLGFVALMSVKEYGITVLWRILPHGIFELPAVFISLGLGVRLGTFFFFNDKKNKLKDLFLNSLRVFILVIVPLLLIASLIEATLIAFGG